MKVEIWSDVACPFCYIGKRRFEKAVEKLEWKDEIELEWKSFQLNPDLKSGKHNSLNQYLSETKGWTQEHAAEMNAHVSTMAEEAGLHYRLDETIVANTYNAHRLIQFAKTKGLASETEELLFSAYFTEGKDLNSVETLVAIGVAAGLEKNETEEILNSEKYSDAVENDAYEASQLGIRGVPFFVFDRKYGISGAQPDEVFDRTFMQAKTEAESLQL